MTAELGQGSASRADLASTTALHTAPAVLGLRGRYDIAAAGRLGPQGERGVQATAIDSTTGPVALGLYYGWTRAEPPTSGDDLPGWRLPDQDLDNPVRHTHVAGALAVGWADRRVAVGIGGEWQREASALADAVDGLNATVSAAARPVEDLVVSVTMEDVFDSWYEGYRRRVGLGVGWQTDRFAVLAESDTPLDEVDPALRAGLRGAVTDWLTLRGGWSLDGMHAVALGVSATSPTMAVDYGVRLGFDGDETTGGPLPSWHGVALRAFF